jgi:hypothetical protein
MISKSAADEVVERQQFFVTICCEGMHCARFRFRVT